MTPDSNEVVDYVHACALGVVAGLRSMLPLAALSLSVQGVDREEQPVHFLGSVPALVVTAVLAGGELIADKLPFVPSRTDAPLIGGRVVTGAIAGGARAQAANVSPMLGALLGALGGWVGSWLGYTTRRGLTRATGAPDFVFALAEDAAAITLARWAVRRQ